MSRNKQLLLILFLISVRTFSQITGNVNDERGNPIAFANVMLFSDPGEALETGVITDDEGRFLIEPKNIGSFKLRISLLSYQTWTSESFEIDGPTFTKRFPSIALPEEVTALEGVAVTGQQRIIQRTQEGSVVNVQASIMTKGSTALQLLERSPGVILDQRNNSFSLNGKSGTLIMINGKPQRIPASDIMSLLNGMSADNIEKIELLTNPSARHDVDGNAGIINIVTTKNEALGFRGNTSLSAGYGEGPKQTTSLSLNYGGERTSLFGSYSFSYDDSRSGWRGVGTSDLPVLGEDTFIIFQSDTYRVDRNHNLSLGYEQQLLDNDMLGLNVTYNRAIPDIATRNLGLYDFTAQPFLEARINLDADQTWNNFTASGFYEVNTANSTLAFTGDFIKYQNSAPNTVNSLYFDDDGLPFQPENEIYNEGNRGFNETDINVGVAKLDFSAPLNEKTRLETGIKGSFSKTVNEARIEFLEGDDFISDPRFITDLINKETIGAAYGIVNHNLNQKVNGEPGLRYEYWDQNFDDSSLDRSFGKLFPSLFLTYTLSDTTAVNFAYNKRITRPNYADLASFLSYNDPTSVFSGNPQLLPAITDNISLTYTNKSFSLSILASNEQNPIARFQIIRNETSEVAVIAPVNLDYQRSLDLQSNIPIRITNRWNLNLNGTLGVRRFKLLHTDDQITHNYVHYNFNGNQTLQLPADIALELSGWYTSEHFNGSIRVKGFGSLNGGIRKSFKNGSSLQFSVTDIFQSIDIRPQTGTLTREAYGGEFDVRYRPESGFSRIYRVTFSYPFGNKKVKNINSRTGADSEKSRIQ
ncbi:TonB-dependent receptor domain-containing protein [Flagellimonas allohymeniacidonis]|uniref:Outer membrane protein beta-barrel domain-containing protein n=1 Tax=Flagellimonas allohymeniacidonis TaxID=2517819 RepID=A0A4Q8QKS5_9FLAO|nr:TonB-dependent receptor [Allomuricauda hymeniacidonis]TAI48846.1 hypothetical protein EW142_03345 [Allomuricauda hymeniacidonis]